MFSRYQASHARCFPASKQERGGGRDGLDCCCGNLERFRLRNPPPLNSWCVANHVFMCCVYVNTVFSMTYGLLLRWTTWRRRFETSASGRESCAGNTTAGEDSSGCFNKILLEYCSDKIWRTCSGFPSLLRVELLRLRKALWVPSAVLRSGLVLYSSSDVGPGQRQKLRKACYGI